MHLIRKPHFYIYLFQRTNRGFLSKIYDKRDDFDFDIVNFPLLNVDGVNISELSCHETLFNAHNIILTAKLLHQGCRYINFKTFFINFIDHTMN